MMNKQSRMMVMVRGRLLESNLRDNNSITDVARLGIPLMGVQALLFAQGVIRRDMWLGSV